MIPGAASEDKLLQSIVTMLLCILLIGWILKRFRQPYFVAYITAGILLGPGGSKLFTDVDTITQIGTIGLIMQMFFIGTEVEVPALLKNSRTLITGTLVQLVLSGVCMVIMGTQLNWPAAKITLFTFIISLSSSAIILEYLHKNNEVGTRLGTITTGILILQDLLIVPMIMTLNFLANESFQIISLLPGLALITLFIIFLRNASLHHTFPFPWPGNLKNDHELQVFIGLLICLGFAWITSIMHLSAALGAMFAGMVISRSESTKWLDKSLIPFRVFFLSFFFLSIGLQVDVRFIITNLSTIATVVIAILIINSGINAVVFRLLGETLKNSVYAGALLSQIGEFGLVLCTVARGLGLLGAYSFQLALAVISLTMLLTSVWIAIVKGILFKKVTDRQRLIT